MAARRHGPGRSATVVGLTRRPAPPHVARFVRVEAGFGELLPRSQRFDDVDSGKTIDIDLRPEARYPAYGHVRHWQPETRCDTAHQVMPVRRHRRQVRPRERPFGTVDLAAGEMLRCP
jgi:hypothetical protein